MANHIELLLPGLDRLAWFSLREEAGTLPIKFEEVAASSGAHGEPVTTAIIVVSLATIRIVAAWLMKEREKGVLRHTIITRSPDGTSTEETIELSTLSSRAPKAGIISALGKLLKLDVGSLLEEDR
jgi:hypothetical protein